MSSIEELKKRAYSMNNSKEAEEDFSSRVQKLKEKAKSGTVKIGTKFNSSDVDDWYNAAYSVGQRAYSYLTKEGYKRTNSDLLTEIDSYLGKAEDVAHYLSVNKSGYEDYDSVAKSHYDMVNYLRSLKSGLTSSNDFYSEFKDEEDYNFWDTHSTPEKRQAWYKEQQDKVDDLGSYYDNYYTIDLLYQDYKANPNAYTPEEAQDIVAKYEKHNTYKQKYGSITDVKAEIEAAEAEMRKYERGQNNENGRFYGSKVVDDNHAVTQRDDFGITSAKRDYANPTKEDLLQYDAYNDSSTWYYDANGVYRDVRGNELVEDDSGNLVSPLAKDTQVKDKLGAFLSFTEDDIAEAQMLLTTPSGESNSWAQLWNEGNQNSWKYLDDTELGIYYTYLGESQEKAYQYLEDMTTELNRRRTLDESGQWAKAYDDAGRLGKIFMEAVSVPASLVSGVTGSIANAYHTVLGEEINPYSRAHSGMHYSNTVVGKRVEELDASGNSFLGVTPGDVYQFLNSRAVSALATGVFGPAGTIVLGMGAAQQEAYRLYEQGASDSQIAAGSLAAGAAEVVFEYVSFDKLINLKNSKTFLQWVKNALIQGGIEASEEAATELSNIISNAVIMGSQSDIQKLYEEYGDWNKVGLALVQQVLEAGVGGFFGGFMSGGYEGGKSYINTQIQYGKTGKEIKAADGGVKALQDLAMKVAGASEGKFKDRLTKQAGKIGEKSTWVKVGRFYNDVTTANKIANTSANQADIAKSLERKGFSKGTANDIASAIVAQYNGQDLTKAQEKLLKSAMESKVVRDAISNIVTNQQSTMGQRQQNIRDFHKDVKAGQIAKRAGASVDMVKRVMEVGGKYVPKNETPTDVEHEVSDDGKTHLKSDPSKTVNIKKIASINKGKIVFETDDGTVDASDVVYATEDEALVYEAIASVGDIINADDANRLVQGFSKAQGMSATVYARGVAQAYKYGYWGYSMADAENSETFSSSLTVSQRNTAFAFGRVQRKNDVAKAQEEKAKFKEAAEKAGKVEQKGGVYFRNGTDVADIDSYMDQAGTVLKDVQKVAIETMKNLSEALGIEFVVYESYVRDGERYYIDEDGNEVAGAPNGWYDQKTGMVYIDLHAGNYGRGVMLFTIAHELTHFIHQWSPAKFAKLADIVFSHGKMKGKVSALVAQKMLAAKARGKAISEAVAYEEVVADAMESILKSGRVMEMVADIKQQDRGLWQKICDWFKNLADYMKRVVNAYQGKNPDSVEGRMVAEMKGIIKQLEAVYAEALVDASENFTAAQAQFSTDSIRGTADGAVPQSEVTTALTDGDSLKSERTEYEYLPKQMMSLSDGSGTLLDFIEGLTGKKIKGLSGKAINGYTGREVRAYAMGISGFSKAQIERVNKFMDSMSEFMEKAGVQYKFIGLKDVKDAKLHYTYNADGSIKSIVLSAMVKNGDYPVNFDLSSICKKRVAMSKLVDKLAKRGSLDNGTVKLTPANIFKINTVLKNAGYETACLGCFVESKRYNSLEWAKKFCNKWNAAVKKVNPNATYFGYGDDTFSEDSFTLEQAVKIDAAATKYITATKTERLANALKQYQAKAEARQPLVAGKVLVVDGKELNTFSKAARDRLAKSDTISDELKTKYLNCDVSTLNMADVEFLLENGILPGASLSNKQAVAEMVKSGEAYQHLLKPSDLLTDRGISKLEALPNFHGVLYGHYGSGTPKLMQSYTPYNSEIALLPSRKNSDQSLAEYLYTIAGVRMQSFSDFQIQNIYDYLQMVADLAARKLPAHAYTKEISFAKLLGMTGIKVNLSVMFDIDPMVDKAHAGLTKLNKLVHRGEYAKVVLEDEQGKWVYNIGDYQTQKMFAEAYPDEAKRFLQSIGFGDAVKLQSSTGYSANCGIIGVGYSDLGIIAMLNDNRIRYIIPYHASSLPAEIKLATNIALGTDYTPYQNNMKIKEIVDRNGKKVNWTVKEAYKRLRSGQAVINELNEKIRTEGWVVSTTKAQNGHGSYGLYENLQETNDPRQTAGNFMDWCIGNGTLPLFYQFASHANYYKLLYDFNVYDCVTEEYAPQQAVTNTYPTMVDGQVQPGNVTEGNFDAEYFKDTVDKQMAFMDEYSRNLNEDLDALAEDLESGEKTVMLSERLDPRKVTSDDVLDLVLRAAYEFDEGTYIPVRASTPPILIEIIKRHSKGNFIPMDLPMIMKVEKVRQATEEDDDIEYEHDRPHGISAYGMVDIFRGMGDPAYIVYQKNGRYAEIIRYRDKTGKMALASVDFYGLGDKVKYKYAQYMNGYDSGLYNVVVTTYNPDDMQAYLDDPDNIIIYDKKKGLPEVGSGSKLPSHLTDKPFYENIITDTEDDVKRISKRDSDYLEVVKRGDMKTAQIMVDEASKEAGFEHRVFHGTPVKFNSFNTDIIYVSANKKHAKEYGSNVLNLYMKSENPYITKDGVIRDDNGEPFMLDGEEVTIGWLDAAPDVLDYLISKGYDAAWDADMEYAAIFKAENLKSADPVTYDDDGNVIPLSKRFNKENDDIRYSKRGDLVSEQNKFSMRDTVEETKDLLAFHNITPALLWDVLNRKGLVMPSLAITNKGMNDFGEISLLFDKSTIDPNQSRENKLYGADAWTPTQTNLKKNAKFDTDKTVRAVNTMKNRIGSKYVSELLNITPKQFKETILQADGSIYDAYAHNIGVQAAYAMEHGIISKIPTTKSGAVDMTALQDQLNKELDTDNGWRQYKKWLNNISDTVITSYDQASNVDILNNMKAQPASAKTFKLSENGELIVPAKEYSSVKELRRNKSRLSENADEATKAVAAEFMEFAKKIGDTQQVVECINAGFAGRYNIADIVKAFRSNGIEISSKEAGELQSLYKKAVELPTQYFEAKPGREVGLNEIKAVVMPANSSPELRSALEELGIDVIEYDGTKESRTVALNSVESLKFSDRDDLTPEQQKHFDYNQKQVTVGATLKTLKGSAIKRSTKYGVGKEIGGEIYFHKDYAEDIVPDEVLSQALQLLEEEHPGFEYNCLKYNPKTGVVAFQEAPDFDTAREPVVGDYVSVNTNTGVVKTGHSNYIWHHKWNWVKNDYSGFDVEESWNWSKQWLSTLTEVSDGNGIGRWNTQLDKFGLPKDGDTKKSGILYQLREVEPVQPTSDNWRPAHNESWFAENGFPLYRNVSDEQRSANEQYEMDKRSGGHGTQNKSTLPTYEKIFKFIKDRGDNPRILDASAGLGLGTELGKEYGLDIHDIEPFPNDKYKPEWTDYDGLQKMVESGSEKPFDLIISNAVLNVLAQDSRDNLVAAMDSLLAPGGQMFINVIGKDYAGAKNAVPEIQRNSKGIPVGTVLLQEGENGAGREVFVWQSNSVQKVFSPQELKSYIQDALGDGYVVETPAKAWKGSNLSGTMVVITKPGSSENSVMTEGQPLYSERDTDATKLESDLKALQQEQRELEDQLDTAVFDGLSDADTRKLKNRLIKVNAEIDKIFAEERRATVKTSMQEILDNLSNYRRSDLESLAAQISDGAWDDVESMSREDLEEALRETIQNQELSPIEMQNRKYGLWVRPVSKTNKPLFSERTEDSVSNRSLLANAFETVTKDQVEYQAVQEYKSIVPLLDKEEQKLQRLNEEIKALSFGKGPRDTKKIRELRDEATKTANRISVYDGQLLRLEASAPLQKVLDREKKKAYQRAEQKGKQALADYKAKAEAKQKAALEEWRESRKTAVAKARESAEKRDARAKLQKLVMDTVKWITYPAKTDVKCPDILKPFYKDFLDSIDLSSKRLANGGDPTKNDLRLTSAMESLATALDKVMTSQDPTKDVDKVLDIGYLDLPADFVVKLRDMTEAIKGMMVEGDYVVNNMTAEEVRKLSQMIRTLNHAIKTMSNLYANLRFANIEALGADTMEFMDALGEIEKTGGMKDFVQWDNALPYYAFKRFGKGGESVFEGLMDAQDKLAFLAKKIFEFQEKAWTAKEAKAWSEDTHTIELPGGDNLTLTTADAMSIYCLSRREQGLQHLLGGGTRVLGLQKGSKKAKDSRSLLTIKDIDAINSSLTDRQKQVAEAIQKFMSTVCSEWGNEISMKRFLTKEFTEKFYFPIESNDENLPVKDPAAQQSDLFRLLNISATKPLTPGANNEVIIRNIFDVFTGHASDMARLNAYGMGLLDYMKWLNYREKTSTDEGQIKVRGVRKSMQTAYGDAAMGYVLNLVKDVNGRASDNGDPKFWMKWMRAAKTASVGSSFRVASLQFTSYPRALLVLSPKSLALGLSKLPKIEMAKKYCGIALWKSFGFYDTNISRSIEDQMKGVKDVKQKLIELSLKGAEWGDAITWGALWNACEYEVAATKEFKVGTEEFYQAVGKKLRDVVYRTQVVDSMLTRSQIMRSKSGMAQEAAAFMSEPTLSANILMDAGFEFGMEKRRNGTKSAWAKTGSYIGKAVAVYFIGQLAAALLEGFWDAWRDEEDEEFWNKWNRAFVENFVLDLLPFNKLPILSDAVDLAMSQFGFGFFSSDKMTTTWLSQTNSALQAWKEFLGGESSMTAYNALYKSVRALSSFVGVSISGVMREGVALWNNTAGAYDSTLKIRTWELSDADLAGQALKAITEGNTRQADSLKAKFPDEKTYQSAMRTAIKDSYTAGDIGTDTATKYLVKYGGLEEDDAYWKVEEWKYEASTGEDFAKYDNFITAVETGKELKTVISKYTSNGVSKETLASQITSHFKPLYKQMSNYERASIKGYLLNAYEQLGYDRAKKSKDIDKWLED